MGKRERREREAARARQDELARKADAALADLRGRLTVALEDLRRAEVDTTGPIEDSGERTGDWWFQDSP
jgi:hypothetical protein